MVFKRIGGIARNTVLSLKQRDPLFVQRAFRFALTGVFVTGVHAFIAIVFIEGIFPSPTLANGIAFVVATMVSYAINTAWSFSARLHGETLRRFFLVSLLGFFLATSIAWMVQELGLHYLIGIAAITLALPPVTFCLHNFWTYR